jgi:hypothetical protein
LPTAPRLDLSHTSSSLTFSWPTYWVGYNLVSAPTVPSPTWSPLTPGPTMVGGRNILTRTIGTGNQFFRLKY